MLVLIAAAAFAVVTIWDQPECPSPGDWLTKYEGTHAIVKNHLMVRDLAGALFLYLEECQCCEDKVQRNVCKSNPRWAQIIMAYTQYLFKIRQ